MYVLTKETYYDRYSNENVEFEHFLPEIQNWSKDMNTLSVGYDHGLMGKLITRTCVQNKVTNVGFI